MSWEIWFIDHSELIIAPSGDDAVLMATQRFIEQLNSSTSPKSTSFLEINPLTVFRRY